MRSSLIRSIVASLALLTVVAPQAGAQDDGNDGNADDESVDTTGQPSPSPTSDVLPPPEPSPTAVPPAAPSSGVFGGSSTARPVSSVNLATVGAEYDFDIETSVVGPVVPTRAAARESRVLLAGDVFCADDSSSYVDSVSGEELADIEAAAEAERAAIEGASGEEILAAIPGNSDAGSSAVSGKAVKRPVSRQGFGVFARQDGPVDVDAVLELFAEEEADTESPVVDDGACDVAYVCGAERIDDVVSGRIDSEPSGAYAEYVTGVAVGLDALTATIREVESAGPGGELVDIPVPSSEQGVVSLMDALAGYGLGVAPGELFLPEFNYCRVGVDGPIETDPDADVLVLPAFTWTPVDDEFDTDGTSRSVLASIEAQLLGRLPDMRAIPPMDTGVTIVQFPMWLWLDDPLTFASAEGMSGERHIRVRGRAFLDHVTWTLGEHELVCSLDEMEVFMPDSGMDVGDTPECHHVFTELEEYTVTAAATYRIEQQVSIRRSTGLAFPETAWTPHPVDEFVTVESTSGPMRVEEIYSINVPLDYTSDN